jgi:hypothetical protein
MASDGPARLRRSSSVMPRSAIGSSFPFAIVGIALGRAGYQASGGPGLVTAGLLRIAIAAALGAGWFQPAGSGSQHLQLPTGNGHAHDPHHP